MQMDGEQLQRTSVCYKHVLYMTRQMQPENKEQGKQ